MNFCSFYIEPIQKKGNIFKLSKNISYVKIVSTKLLYCKY